MFVNLDYRYTFDLFNNIIYTFISDIHVLRTKFVDPFALMSNQPTLTTSSSSNAFIRTPSSANSTGKTLIHVCHTIRFVTSK